MVTSFDELEHLPWFFGVFGGSSPGRSEVNDLARPVAKLRLSSTLLGVFGVRDNFASRGGLFRSGGVGGIAPKSVSVLSSNEVHGELREPAEVVRFEGVEGPLVRFCVERDLVTGPGDGACQRHCNCFKIILLSPLSVNRNSCRVPWCIFFLS